MLVNDERRRKHEKHLAEQQRDHDRGEGSSSLDSSKSRKYAKAKGQMKLADLPQECCSNIGKDYLVYCNRPATHWYLHNDDICSYCDEHDYQCGEKTDLKDLDKP